MKTSGQVLVQTLKTCKLAYSRIIPWTWSSFIPDYAEWILRTIAFASSTLGSTE